MDLLFLDCHDVPASFALLDTMLRHGLLARNGYIALHDTGLHPVRVFEGSRPVAGDEPLWVHQPAERRIADWLIQHDPQGAWQRVSFHDDWRRPYRHGLTIMQRKVPFLKPQRPRT